MLSLVLGGCGLEAASTSSTSNPIVGGSTAARPGSPSVVFLGDCSGVLVNPHVVLTAEHCLPVAAPPRGEAPVRAVRLALRRGERGGTCLTPTANGCEGWELAIVRQPASDLVALRSELPFPGVTADELPLTSAAAELPPTGAAAEAGVAYVHGYGVSEGGGVGTRVSAPVEVAQYSPDYVYARTAPGVRVCGGDSGGPLFAEPEPRPGQRRAAALIGVVSATQYDPEDPHCTAERGLQRFARPDPAFLRAAAGPCTETAGALDCRGGGAVAELAGLVALEQARDAIDGPGMVDRLRTAGFELIDPTGVSAERVTSEGLVGVATDEGTFLARVPASAEPPTSKGALVSRGGGGGDGELIPLSPRALSLSGNGDQRVRMFIAQSGGLSTTSTTGTPGCTATLIGPRIVRTAKHCIENTTRPWFTLRYDGGPTTWTFNGGATFVTFNPRQADGHFFGGNYFNFNCHTSSGASTASCMGEDWALLIMPQDVWQPVHVLPSFMGFATAQLGAVTNSGYARCSDISNPNLPSCTTGFMYGMSCTVKSNSTSHYFSNCDTSPGQSGGGTFFTSGGTRFLIGNHKGGPSNAGCPDGTCTSYDTGTNSWLFDFQNQQRAAFSAVTL